MSATWPLPTDLAGPGSPESYRTDTVDEMTAGGLSVLAEVRKRIEAELVESPATTQRALAVVDGYAREILEEAGEERDDDFDEDPDAFPTMLAEAARRRSSWMHVAYSRRVRARRSRD